MEKNQNFVDDKKSPYSDLRKMIRYIINKHKEKIDSNELEVYHDFLMLTDESYENEKKRLKNEINSLYNKIQTLQNEVMNLNSDIESLTIQLKDEKENGIIIIDLPKENIENPREITEISVPIIISEQNNEEPDDMIGGEIDESKSEESEESEEEEIPINDFIHNEIQALPVEKAQKMGKDLGVKPEKGRQKLSKKHVANYISTHPKMHKKALIYFIKTLKMKGEYKDYLKSCN